MSAAPASAIFSCCAAASSNAHPLAIDCATDPLTPAPSSSVRVARKIACGERSRSSSFPAVRAPSPGVSRNASQTEPAKLLAVFVVDTDEKELTTSVEQDSSSRSKK
jgi:hypothetical protein